MAVNTAAVTVRDLRPEDHAAARALILAGLAEHWGQLDPTCNPDLDDIAGYYADAVFLGAWADAALVGTGALTPETGGVGRIARMSVAADWRRRGIGGRILAVLCARARARDYRKLVLETTATWAEAIAFYQQHGFRPVAHRDGDLHFEMTLA